MIGVTESAGVVLGDGQRRYLEILRASVPESVPIHVTSGTRTSSAQASAMLAKVKAAEAIGRSAYDELHAIYRNDALVDVLLALPREITAWASVIESRRLLGDLISAHQRADSFDLRSSNVGAAEMAALKAAITATGGKYLHEDAPPHLHVDLPKSDPSTWRPVQVAVGVAVGSVGLVAGVAAAIVGGIWFLSSKGARTARKGKA